MKRNKDLSNIDGIIFDVDGTLWDSTGVVAEAFNRVFEEMRLSVRVDADDLKQLFGKQMDVIFRTLAPDLPEEKRDHLTRRCVEEEERALETADADSLLYPGVEEMFRNLSEKYPLYIVSNCQCGYIEQFLRKTGYGGYIRDHLCFGQTGTSKGQTILRLMEMQERNHPVYVGDTEGDAAACREAGIPFIYAAYGFGTVGDADGRIKSPVELTEML